MLLVLFRLLLVLFLKHQQLKTTTESPLKCHKSPKKTAAQTEPEWFTRFAAQQQKVNEDLIKLNKEVLQVAKDTNEILKSLVDALKK